MSFVVVIFADIYVYSFAALGFVQKSGNDAKSSAEISESGTNIFCDKIPSPPRHAMRVGFDVYLAGTEPNKKINISFMCPAGVFIGKDVGTTEERVSANGNAPERLQLAFESGAPDLSGASQQPVDAGAADIERNIGDLLHTNLREENQVRAGDEDNARRAATALTETAALRSPFSIQKAFVTLGTKPGSRYHPPETLSPKYVVLGGLTFSVWTPQLEREVDLVNLDSTRIHMDFGTRRFARNTDWYPLYVPQSNDGKDKEVVVMLTGFDNEYEIFSQSCRCCSAS